MSDAVNNYKNYRFCTLVQYLDPFLFKENNIYNVQKMNNSKKITKLNFKDSEFNLLRYISSSSEISQRKLALKMGFSLGKLNYCLKELRKKGFLKIENFKKNPNKLSYIYKLTPSGVAIKTKLTITFMKRKMKEYEELKKEINEKK